MLIDTGLIVVGSLAAANCGAPIHRKRLAQTPNEGLVRGCANFIAMLLQWISLALWELNTCWTMWRFNSSVSNHVFKGIGMFPESCTQLMFYAHLCSGFGCINGASTALRIFLPQSATHDSNPMRVRATTWDLGLWSWLTKSRARQMSAQKNLRFKRFRRSFQEKLY